MFLRRSLCIQKEKKCVQDFVDISFRDYFPNEDRDKGSIQPRAVVHSVGLRCIGLCPSLEEDGNVGLPHLPSPIAV